MKTVISVNDALMAEADDCARNPGPSRSGLVADAIRAYLNLKRHAQISEQLNGAYADDPTPEEEALVKNMRANFRPSDRREIPSAR